MSTTEERVAALEAKAIHIEEQIGALETDVKRLKESLVGQEAYHPAKSDLAGRTESSGTSAT